MRPARLERGRYRGAELQCSAWPGGLPAPRSDRDRLVLIDPENPLSDASICRRLDRGGGIVVHRHKYEERQPLVPRRRKLDPIQPDREIGSERLIALEPGYFEFEAGIAILLLPRGLAVLIFLYGNFSVRSDDQNRRPEEPLTLHCGGKEVIEPVQ